VTILVSKRAVSRVSGIRGARYWSVLAICLIVAWTGSVLGQEPVRGGWDRQAAAAYLDGRQNWWMDWPTAARDQGTYCVSCHTVTPYALGRAALRRVTAPGVVERRMLDSVEHRVLAWDEMQPFYSDEQVRPGKTRESRGTEAILNVLILANRDAQAGRLSGSTKQAFEHLWALQRTDGADAGAWAWLDFGLEPWETSKAQYYGAALAAVAVGLASQKGLVHTSGMVSLRTYLRTQLDDQNLFNRLTVLWASGEWAGVLASKQRSAIIQDTKQMQRDDGGWSLSDFGTFERRDGTRSDRTSDAYGTGLATLALQRAHVSANDPALVRGLQWLRKHQRADGSWYAASLNRDREPDSDRGRFMSDAATAYAVLSLAAHEAKEQ